jgi:N-acetyl-alpha-D-glucosaminyl L-malate synthase BshA
LASENERIITHISNFRKVKRIPDVIKIFYKIQQSISAKLLMVGDGPEKERAENLCNELGIADKVIFLGNSNEIDRILSYSDLFLLPSETESFGLAALEAMAWSVPVISSNSGGLPEVNLNAVSGYLSDVGNIDEMADEIKKFVKPDDIKTANFILVNLGEKNNGGYGVEVESVVEEADKVIVTIKEIEPKKGNVTMAITNPYAVIKINSKKPIEIK